MNTSFNLMKNLNESTKPEIKKTRKLREAVQNITEGAGAGYHITGTIKDVHVNSFSIAETTEDKYNIPTYILDCDINAELSKVSFESYEYGGSVDTANIHITKVCLTDNHEPDDKGELNNTNIEQSLDETTVKSLIGGGWIHSTFDGEVEFEDDNASGSPYADFYVSGVEYNFTDEELVRYIDLAVIGENITDEFIVYSADDELERFDSEEEAIEYAKNTPEALKVEQLSYVYDFDGDIDTSTEYSEVVWEKDEYEESENIDSSNILTETTNRGIENMKQDLYSRERQALKDLGDENYENLTMLQDRLPKEMYDAFEKEEAEIRAIEMIHSILVYTSRHNWNVDYVMNERYMKRYIDDLGEDRVRELVQQEVDEFNNNAQIDVGTYTDNEGLTYNSVTFTNESEENLVHPELNKDIKEFYTKSFKDELANELNDGVTFLQLYRALKNGNDVYELIGISDSLVRERLFEELASILNQDYDYVYNMWLNGTEDGQPNIVKESEKLDEKLNSNEKIVFSKKVLDAETDNDLKNIAHEIRYYSEPTYTKCMEIINGDGSVQYKAGQISDMIYQLNESEKLIEEEKVTDNLQEIKSQGNIFMLQDGESKYIVGENYNEEEKLIENAEIYKTKEDADKDYFSRCEVRLNDQIVDPTSSDLAESVDNIKLNLQANKRARIVNKMNNELGGLRKYQDDLKNIDDKIEKSVSKLSDKRHDKIANLIKKDKEKGIPFKETTKKADKIYNKETGKIVKAVMKSHKNG